MDIKKVTVNNRNFEFVCSWHDTRYGFAHDCTMFINGSEHNTAHCYYLNRTWESWNYQSVCLQAVALEIDDYMNDKIRDFKEEHGYKNLTAKRRLEFDDSIKDDSYLNDLKACYDDLRYKLH